MNFQRTFNKYTSLCVCLLFISTSVTAQFGIRVKANFDQNADVNTALQKRFGAQKSVFVPGYEIGFDYWLTLKKKRIEFLPEIAGYFASNEIVPGVTAASQRFIFNIHTQIYALDLNEDCNCPTFSKQGPSINKGFFFHVTPGLALHRTTFDVLAEKTNLAEDSNTDQQQWLFHIGLGLGLDFGINELVTITPMVSYYFHSTSDYNIVETTTENLATNTNFTQLQFQVRTGFRFDYRRTKYGRRR